MSDKVDRETPAPVRVQRMVGRLTDDPKWPDGSLKNENVCKSELQLLSEVHAMLTSLSTTSRLSEETKQSQQ